jgi:GPH family glycoside/pentoside/hexuronide:cation symporter
MDGIVSPDGKLPVIVKFGYGIGDLAANIVFQTVSFFLIYYYTDVFAIGTSAAGIVFFISKLWNAICDPTMGYIADRTQTRWGKNRPFILLGAIPLGITFFLLFSSPHLSGLYKTIYALLTFLAFSTAYSVINVPYGALTANLTIDAQERSTLTGYRMTFAILGTLIAAGATKPIVLLFQDELVGFRIIGVVYGIICVIVNIVTFALVREQVLPDREESMSFVEDLKLVLKNRPFVILTASTILQNIAINLMAAMINYYFKYNLNAESYIPFAFLCLLGASMITLPIWVFVSNRFGKRIAYIAGMIILISALIMLRIFPLSGIKHVLILFMIGGIGMATQYLCPWSMIPDTVEYSQLKTGLRREGILYGFFNFAIKFSAAFSGIIAGFGLDYVNYMPNVIQQEKTLLGIFNMITFIPMSLIIAGIILIYFYPIDTSEHERIVKAIAFKK